MPTAKITCPRCSKSFRADKPFDVGSRLRCPRCHAAFTARPEDIGAPPDDPAPRRTAGWLPLVAVVGVALLLLLGSGAALAVFLVVRAAAHPTAAPLAARGDPGASGRPPFNPAMDPEPPAQAWLPPDKQDDVNRAIERGVAYLKTTEKPEGTWSPFIWQVGLSGLPGLTLLECGAPPDDPHVRAAADYVRKNAPRDNKTYELALSILFLDRLGDPQDESLIRTMALRLMAGQSPAGGWTYDCPILSEPDQAKVWTLLQTTRPQSSLELVASNGDGRVNDLFSGRVGAQPSSPPAGGPTVPLSPGPSDEERTQAKAIYDGLSGPLKNMPALQPPLDDRLIPMGDSSDNSNTQFATLGLWAAGRHGVPMERALARLAQRFRVSQVPDGGWVYVYQPRWGAGSQPAMTGAGLLGVAVGHGLTADLKGPDVAAAGGDPAVEKGMNALARHIGAAQTGPGANKYFLWSVERVGMLYNRRTIGDKDWYPWGADVLVKTQLPNGAWANGSYPGASPASDTCFALLFLKRANLAKDLTNKVQFLTQVK